MEDKKKTEGSIDPVNIEGTYKKDIRSIDELYLQNSNKRCIFNRIFLQILS